MTQKELATRAGLSTATLSDLEQGRTHRPFPKSVRALVLALGLSGDDAQALRRAAAGQALPRAAGRPPTRTAGQTSHRTAEGAHQPATTATADQPPAIAVLGPLVIRDVTASSQSASGRARILLARLAMSPNAAVSRGELIHLLWDDAGPSSAVNLVQTYVARLRRLLPAGELTRAAGGYQLTVDEDQLDLLLFRRLVQDARRHSVSQPERTVDLLDRALRLWRGEPVADIDALIGHPLVVGLVDERTSAAVLLADVAELVGRHERSLPHLTALAERHPLDERLHARLMLALAAAGQQAAALAVYDAIEHRLVTDLGVAPGPELDEYRKRVLRQQWTARSTVPVPAQLPPDVCGFTGRAAELKRLDEILAGAADEPTAVVISALSGSAGVGKTALTVHWAHSVAGHFPDGQLYVNLRGFDPAGAALTPSEALRRFLESLGAPPQQVPADLEAQTGLYRSLLTGKRVLVVLDNARDAAQVRPLLPGAPGCLVVVTSRDRLTGLVVAEGAQPLSLDLFTIAESWQLLARRIGADRMSADPVATDEIIFRCARLPLALAVVAAQAAGRPDFPLRELAEQLCEDSLGAFAHGDLSTDITAVFSWSYRALDPVAARLFRLLGLHPGPDVSAPAAASLAGIPLNTARATLADLTRVHLLNERSPGRYSFHDLLRAYAAQLAERYDHEADRQAAVHRLLDHYLHATHAAAIRVNAHRDPPDLAPIQPLVVVEPPADPRQAMTWYLAEHSVLLAMVRLAADAGLDGHAWRLAWALADYLDRQGHWREVEATQSTGLAAAQRLNDPLGQAQTRRDLARVCGRHGRFDEGHAHLDAALELHEALGDRVGLGHTYGNIFVLLEWQGRYREALDAALRSLEHYQAADHKSGMALVNNNIGYTYTRFGEYEQALAYCRRAHRALCEIGFVFGEAATCDSIGYIHHQIGDHGEAVTWYRRALELYRELGERRGTCTTLTRLGDVCYALGDVEGSRAAWREALAILDLLDPRLGPEAAELRAKLDQL